MTKLVPIPCLLALAAVLGCGETQEQLIDQLTFDRPVDIAFACHGNLRITNGGTANRDQPVEISAMPPSACETRSGPPVPLPQECQPAGVDISQNPDDPKALREQPTPPGQGTLRETDCSIVAGTGLVSPVSWYGLILQSGPGTVGIATFATAPGASLGSDGQSGGVTVLDADPLTPGKNGISVGEEPIAIHTDPAGCHAITANAGSCDLSVLELNSALSLDGAARVDRLKVKNAAGVEMHARPVAMVGEASSELIGERCPAGPTGLVYLAYPSCHLVAAVDTRDGTIVSGIQFGPTGTPAIVDGNVTCPAECGGGGAVTPGVRPVTLDIQIDPNSFTRRLAIGADNSASITVVDLDTMWRPTALKQIALEDTAGTLGITSIALSPEIGMGGNGPIFDDAGSGGQFQFVYATATDGTVRVADVLTGDRECDTQVDARFARANQNVFELSCLTGGTPLTPRRAGARSPGIHLPGEAIPLSVDFFRSTEPTGTARLDKRPATLLGHFAAITASNGSVFVVNVDDDNYDDSFIASAPLAAPVQLVMAHQLRDEIGSRGQTIDDEDARFNPNPDPSKGETDNTKDDRTCDYAGGVGGPRAAAPPARATLAGSISADRLTQLPGFRQILCDRTALRNPDTSETALGKPDKDDTKAISELMFAAPPAVRDRAFPDLGALSATETWTMIWEGLLSLNTGATDIDGPAIREGVLKADALGLHVLDDTRPFCDAGVESFDILQLRGCDPSIGAADCPAGYTCFVHPKSEVSGLGACMLEGEADRLANACRDYLTTRRRYTIRTASSGELIALPRRLQLSTTPLDGCDDDSECENLADYASRFASGRQPVNEPRPCNNDGTCDSGESNATCASDCAPRWGCVADPLRAPMGGTGKRCELRCSIEPDPDEPGRFRDDCPAGTRCEGAEVGQVNSGFCMEGVIPPQACINASQRYELRAGEAFAVIGSEHGFVHPIIENAAGQCVRDPMASPLSIGRLPLMPHDPLAPSTVHMCDPAADPITGKPAGGAFEPNPCLTTVQHYEVVPPYLSLDPASPDVCKPDPNVPDPYPTPRDVPAVRFRNRQMTVTIVDPYYPGDAVCITDRGANRGQIPHVLPGLTLSFRQTAGFVPMQLFSGSGRSSESLPSLPVKVVRGPTDSIWVVDEGDFLSSSVGTASTRGKVLRVHPSALSAISVLR
jgi:hypothetical protein